MPDETCKPPPLQPTADATVAAAAPAGLVIVPTPIGNLRDMTARATEALRTADVVLCEDTRVTTRLFAAYGIGARLLTLHEHNEDSRIAAVLEALRAGRRVALLSDAGTPLVSDPGYRLVRAVIAAGLPLSALPGANAAVTALVLSGLPPQPFLFLGFPPPRPVARRAAFARLREIERAGLAATLIWYEAPHRVAATLADLAAVLGARPAVAARELTKRFEEVRRGKLPELAEHYATNPARGEFCLLVGPAAEEPATAGADFDTHLRAALATHSLKDAVALTAAATGLPRRQVYARALALGGRAIG